MILIDTMSTNISDNFICISEEETEKYIAEFIRYIFREVQKEGWKTRRNGLQVHCGYWKTYDDFTDDMTFDKMMERNNYDLDKVISTFFCKILNKLGNTVVWFKSWISQLRPDLDMTQRPLFWEIWAWNSLNNFMYIEKSIMNYELVKEVLGLDFDLK